MIHGELVGWELLATIVAFTFVELAFPPWCTFKFAGLVAFFANSFRGLGIRIDFVIGFSCHSRILHLSRERSLLFSIRKILHKIKWLGNFR